MTKCFMKLFKAFRMHKYGTEFTPEKVFEYPQQIRRGMQNIDSQLTLVDNQIKNMFKPKRMNEDIIEESGNLDDPTNLLFLEL